jgi:hypothetical protein
MMLDKKKFYHVDKKPWFQVKIVFLQNKKLLRMLQMFTLNLSQPQVEGVQIEVIFHRSLPQNGEKIFPTRNN